MKTYYAKQNTDVAAKNTTHDIQKVRVHANVQAEPEAHLYK